MSIEIKPNHRKNYIYISVYVHRDKNKPYKELYIYISLYVHRDKNKP